MVRYSSTTAIDDSIYTTTSKGDDSTYTAINNSVVYNLCSVTAIIEEIESIIINISIKNYIEIILTLLKWYIIYTFNCFCIRAPC